MRLEIEISEISGASSLCENRAIYKLYIKGGFERRKASANIRFYPVCRQVYHREPRVYNEHVSIQIIYITAGSLKRARICHNYPA